jgi:hypothetical protein
MTTTFLVVEGFMVVGAPVKRDEPQRTQRAQRKKEEKKVG